MTPKEIIERINQLLDQATKKDLELILRTITNILN